MRAGRGRGRATRAILPPYRCEHPVGGLSLRWCRDATYPPARSAGGPSGCLVAGGSRLLARSDPATCSALGACRSSRSGARTSPRPSASSGERWRSSWSRGRRLALCCGVSPPFDDRGGSSARIRATLAGRAAVLLGCAVMGEARGEPGTAWPGTGWCSPYCVSRWDVRASHARTTGESGDAVAAPMGRPRSSNPPRKFRRNTCARHSTRAPARALNPRIPCIRPFRCWGSRSMRC